MNKTPITIGGIQDTAFAETPGISFNIYMSGCNFKCVDCHNPDMQDVNYGKEMMVSELLEMVKKAIPPCTHVCILGGEPTYQYEALLKLLQGLQDLPVQVWLYTGNELEDVKELCAYCDVIKTGRYVKELHNPNKRPASLNQKYIRTGRVPYGTDSNYTTIQF